MLCQFSKFAHFHGAEILTGIEQHSENWTFQVFYDILMYVETHLLGRTDGRNEEHKIEQ
jgi:hypothetical protein